ncbi:MAG: OmpA family protein [Candidatus Neomarinimicrobiota bacterium]
MKRKLEKLAPPSAPFWMVTYGDMMTLLVTFFVLIVAYSSIEQEKFMGAIESFRGALGVLKSHESIQDKPYMSFNGMMDQTEIVNRIRQMQETIEAGQLQGDVHVEVGESGMNIRLGDQVLFDPGRAELKPGAFPLLISIASVVRGLTHQIYVEGHTDNVPINTPQYPSNWELSSARSLSVVKYLHQEGKIPARFLAAVGHGEHRPLTDNDTAAGRSKNRRVEIFITWD